MGEKKVTKLDIGLVVADFLFSTHRYHKAIDFYKECQILLNKSEEECWNFSLATILHHQLARVYLITNEFQEAFASVQQVLKNSKEIKAKKAEETVYQGISWAFRCTAQPFQVIFWQSKLHRAAKENGDKQKEGVACVIMAQAYSALGKQDKVIEFESEALRICREIGDRRGEGKVLRDLGSVYRQLLQYHKAIPYLEESLKILKEVGDYRGTAMSYQQLGSTYQEIGGFQKALDCHFKSLKIMRVHGDLVDVAACYNNIGTGYHALDRYRDAIEHFQKTLEIATKFEHKGPEGIAHHGLGTCYLSLGQYKKAFHHQEIAVNILKETGDKSAEGRSLSELGRIYNEIGQYKKSIDCFKRALEVGQDTGDKKLKSAAMTGLGAVYYALDSQSCEAEIYARKALEISNETGDKRQMSTNYINLALFYSNNGQYQKSLENYDSAIKIMKNMGDKRGEATALICCASVYDALGKFRTAIEIQQKGLNILREVEDAGREHVVLLSLGIYSADNGELKKACEYLFESISSIERDVEKLQDEHSISLNNLTSRNYWVLCTLLVLQGKVPEALCTAERGRARALVDLMSEKYGVHQRQLSNEIYVNGLRQLSIQNQSTIIFITVVFDHMFFWIMEEGQIRLRLSKLKSGEEDIAGLLNLPASTECEDRSLSAYYRMWSSADERKEETQQRLVEDEEDEIEKESSLQLLYKRLFGPVDDLVQRQDIIIVPDGVLFMVPFSALQDSNAKFLSETFRIRLIPSLTTLELIQTSPAEYHSASGALIVGDPAAHPITRLQPLPEARKEAQEIAALLGLAAIVGNQATKREVLRKMQDVSLIHFAAHGDAERGEIALSPSCSAERAPSKKDFMLTMEDISKVGIRAKLVVLSCCHSGRGKIMKAEGVVGIARAFIASGARSVLVSLWLLNDRSTKEFMIRFYGHLVRDKLSASKALHQSMKWMRETKKYTVSDWAPFVLIGDDVTLNLQGSLPDSSCANN